MAGTTFFALPVRGAEDTNYSVHDNHLWFGDKVIGDTEEVFLDTCDVSYQRGPKLLNLNSRSRGNCAGCRACVHTYRNLYDETVLRDSEQLVTPQQVSDFFDRLEEMNVPVADLEQIAVVTGLFGSEESVVEHMVTVANAVSRRGFNGELMYFGCEVNSRDALSQLAQLGHFALIYAVDNFTNRQIALNPTKAKITLEDAGRTLLEAKSLGIATTYAYIAGLDPLTDMQRGAELLMDGLTRFPIVNIYQVQMPGQIKGMQPDAKSLEYYILARKIFEEVFRGTNFRPRKWENYRPLWYDYYEGKLF